LNLSAWQVNRIYKRLVANAKPPSSEVKQISGTHSELQPLRAPINIGASLPQLM